MVTRILLLLSALAIVLIGWYTNGIPPLHNEGVDTVIFRVDRGDCP